MQKTDIAQQSDWEEDVDDIASNAATAQAILVQNSPIENTPVPNTFIDNTTLLDAEDLIAPNQLNTEKPVWRHPIPRTVMVVVGVSVIGFSFIRLTEGNGLIQGNPNQVSVTATPTPKPQTNNDSQGDVQAKLATIRLQQQMDALKTKKASPASHSVVAPPTATKPKPAKAASPPSLKATTAYNPPPSYSHLPAAKPAQTLPQPQKALLPQARPQQPAPPKDPMEAWVTAANIGSYGNISPGNSTQDSNSESADAAATSEEYQTANYLASKTATNNSDWQPSGGIGEAPQSSEVKPNQPDSLVAQSSQANGWTRNQGVQSNQVENLPRSNYQAGNYSTPGDSLVVGARADGKLETPIAWSGDLQNPNQNFLIQLSQPLKASDGSVAVSKGAYLVARINTATDIGIIQMSAVSVLTTENNRTIEQPLPEGAILILGKGGKPLQAKTTRQDSAGNDLGMVLLSGATNAAGLVNQSTSQSAFSSGGGFQTTITNPEPNYLAGSGQGAAQALVQQMQNRNQLKRQSLESQPNVFVLNQGTSVQVFVNQSVSL